MRVVGLVSGGKDSCYNMMQCVAAGHEIVALANLRPELKDEMDSFMYQTVGHHAIDFYADAMGLPLFRRVIKGTSLQQSKDYIPTANDEVEDLFELLKKVKEEIHVEAVSVGAILSDYQRVRVENVCIRLKLVPLAYLWRRDQSELLEEMINCQLEAIIIKVAALGLEPRKHLGKSLPEMLDHLLQMKELYGLNVCGEGGEYETFTLNCPLFKKAIVIDAFEQVIHSDDAFAAVGYINLKKVHLEDKSEENSHGSAVRTPLDFIDDLNCGELIDEEWREEVDAPVNHQVTELIVVRETEDIPYVPVVKADKKGWCWIGSVAGKGNDPVQAVAFAFNQLTDLLTKMHYRVSDIVAVSMYVQNLALYAEMNAEYNKYFERNPPIRVCVEIPLPKGIPVLLEILAFRLIDGTAENEREMRQGMHVQGMSHWAPANIGPYSQAVRVGDTLYVAGQIGLVPGTLLMVEGGIKAQCKLAIRHMGRIVKAMDPKTELRDVVQGICFVTHQDYVAEARKEWEKLTNNAIVDYVVVPGLPRGALIEWHIWAHRYNSQFEYEETGCYINEKSTKLSLRRRWNYENSVGAIVCQVIPGKDSPPLKHDSLVETFCYVLRKLSQHAKSDVTCYLRVFYKVGGISPKQLDIALREVDDYNFSFSIVPVCALANERTLLSICGIRYE